MTTPVITLLQCDVTKGLPLGDQSVNCVVTSPPYWGLRDYGVAGQLGLESTPDAYVAALVSVFREVRRVLRDDGTVWLNLGDSYNAARNGGHPGGKASGFQQVDERYANRSGANAPGLKAKGLVGIPWMVAFALRADGWYLRQDIIWSKPNPMPESVRDRCTKAHEYLFLLTKREHYYYDYQAMQEDGVYPAGTMAAKGSVTRSKTPFVNGRPPEYKEYNGRRNRRDVWFVTTQPFKGAHFATFPEKLVEPCVLAGCPVGGTVLDPFAGSGTVGVVARRHGRNAVLLDLKAEYLTLAAERLARPDKARKVTA